MKSMRKEFLKGVARSLGVISIYGLIALVVYATGFKIDLSTLPPSISIPGEIISSFNN